MQFNGLFIFVLDRGFVFVGQSTQHPADAFITLDKCACVRRWGTTKGLGELASDGPTSNTVLDKLPDGTMVSVSAIMHAVPCVSAKWKGKL